MCQLKFKCGWLLKEQQLFLNGPFFSPTVEMRQADRDVEAVEEKQPWDLIIRQEGQTQVAAAAADLTTQLSLGTRGHQRIFN